MIVANFFINIWNQINYSSRSYQYATRMKTQKFNRPYLLKPVELLDYDDQERSLLFFQSGFKVSFARLKQMLGLA